MMAKSETNSWGFSTKSVITPSALIFTTPKGRGSSTFCTQITPSRFLSSSKSALKRVSAKATIVEPTKESPAHKMA